MVTDQAVVWLLPLNQQQRQNNKENKQVNGAKSPDRIQDSAGNTGIGKTHIEHTVGMHHPLAFAIALFNDQKKPNRLDTAACGTGTTTHYGKGEPERKEDQTESCCNFAG